MPDRKTPRRPTGPPGARAERSAKTAALEAAARALDEAPVMVRTLDGHILRWGRGLQALYGWNAQEAVGQLAHTLLASEFPAPPEKITADLLRTGEWRGDLQQRDRTGRPITVASQWVLHRTGTATSVVEISQDVTAERRSQTMLEEREARLRSVLETAPDAIITIDERGNIQSFSNAAETLFGYQAGEVVGRHVKLLMTTAHQRKHDGYLRRYLRTGEKRIIGVGRQVEAQRKDGSVFPMELAVGEVTVGGARIFTGFIRDITQRDKLEQELRQSHKMEAIGLLTGGLAHDFNNLLTVILGNLEMLDKRIRDPAAREMLADAREATELGGQLATRLLAFGRRQLLKPRPVALNGLIAGMVDLLRRTLGPTVQIETHLARRLPRILADVGQLENTLLNLAINSSHAMPDGGRLFIESGHLTVGTAADAERQGIVPGDYVTLSVTDTGTGMSTEVLKRAFEPYFTTKPAGLGSGLGLSMIHGFAKQSGGDVQLSSEPGFGTTVRIYLPVRKRGASAPKPPLPPTAAIMTAVGKVTVLVVEDDPRVRKLSVRRLHELGYKVLEADSGPSALAVLMRHETVPDGPARRRLARAIDIVFTDVAMPGGMTGVELAREVQQRWPRIGVVLTSGFSEPSVILDGINVRAGWLAKPFSSAQLDTALRAALLA